MSARSLVGIYTPKIRPRSRLTIMRGDAIFCQSSNNNQRRVTPGKSCWKAQLSTAGRETDERERASQIETNEDLYASRHIPQFYCRLISSPASVLLFQLRRYYALPPLLSLLLETSCFAAKGSRHIEVDRMRAEGACSGEADQFCLLLLAALSNKSLTWSTRAGVRRNFKQTFIWIFLGQFLISFIQQTKMFPSANF